jgi:hypothetical protein
VVPGPTVTGGGDALVIGTPVAELTPRFPISVDPSGIPVRGLPPGTTGEVDVDDEAMLVEPEPHIPDKPDVSSIPEVADIPDDADIPEVAALPGMAAVAGAADPTVNPPPS